MLGDPTGAEMEVGEGVVVEDAGGEVAGDIACPLGSDGGFEDLFAVEKVNELGQRGKHPDEDGDGGDEIESDEGADAAEFAAAEKFPESKEVEGGGDVEGAGEAEKEGGLGGGEEEPGADFIPAEGMQESEHGDHDGEEHEGVAAGFDGVTNVPGMEGEEGGGAEADGGFSHFDSGEGEGDDGEKAGDERGEADSDFAEGFGRFAAEEAPGVEAQASEGGLEEVVVAVEVVKEGFIPGDFFEGEGVVWLDDLLAVEVAAEGVFFVVPKAVGEFGGADDDGTGEDHHEDEVKGWA